MNKLYQELASKIDARITCAQKGNTEWYDKHEQDILSLIDKYMPAGSGFDSGTHIDFDKSTGERIVFNTSFHHMDEMGGYDGWTEHTITVKPSLIFGYVLTISGRNRNQIKEYMYDVFSSTLNTVIE